MSELIASETASENPPLTFHALPLLNGVIALCQLPGRSGDYRADLRDIHAWRPSLVVSMTTDLEHFEFGCQNLGVDIQSIGCRWVHLPVSDFGTPTPEIEAHWDVASVELRRALAGGGRLLFHCRGGCGRSGMMALRLMVECGEAPQTALKRLRAVRPCALETEAQLSWANAGAARGET